MGASKLNPFIYRIVTPKPEKSLRIYDCSFKVEFSTFRGAKHVSLRSKADSNMSARVGCHVSAHRGELAETVIWTAVDDEVDWDQKSLGRESETRSGRRAIKELPPLLEHALNVNLGMTEDLGCTAVHS